MTARLLTTTEWLDRPCSPQTGGYYADPSTLDDEALRSALDGARDYADDLRREGQTNDDMIRLRAESAYASLCEAVWALRQVRSAP